MVTRIPASGEAVALVFVSTGEGELLLAALDSLHRSPPRRPLEVVVVDNASTDGARHEIARRWPEVRVLERATRHWLPANLNLGIAATTAPFVMLCNCDVVFPAGSVDRLAAFLEERPEAGVAGPKFVGPDGRLRRTARRWYTLRALAALRCSGLGDATRFPSVAASLYADWDYVHPRAVDWVPCPATMVRRAALADIGPVDERFRRYFEDVDLCLRMREAGWEVWCVPEAEVVHLERRASTRPLSRAWGQHLASLMRFAWKHKGLGPRPSRAEPKRAAEPEASSAAA